MRERPILFSGPMVRAILAGRKTQTRRVIAPQPGIRYHGDENLGLVTWKNFYRTVEEVSALCPYGAPGDRLWVRETFAIESNANVDSNNQYPPPFTDGRPVKHTPEDGEWSVYWQQPHYRATDPEPEFSYEYDDRKGCKACEEGDPHVHWKPSIYMPRWASRLTLEVKAVRVERVQEISEDDAFAEGISGGDWLGDPVGTYREPWDSINAKRGHGWATNPWVWVIEFERVST